MQTSLKSLVSGLLIVAFSGTGSFAAENAAGDVEIIVGTASAISASSDRQLEQGQDVYLGDAIVTSEDARMRVRFNDGSTLTLGGNARVVVDSWIYDTSEPSKSEQSLTMVKGVFRFVSGKIGKLAPTKVAFATPVATIGIRGTEFVGGELTVGMPPGTPHYGFQIKSGAIEVLSPGGSVVLDEPGEGTFLPLGRTAAPTPVRQWTQEEAAEVDAALSFDNQ